MINKNEIRKMLYENDTYEPIIRNRRNEEENKGEEKDSLVYLDGQKAFEITSRSIKIKKDVFNVPANRLKMEGENSKEKFYTWNEFLESKKDLLICRHLYRWSYPKKITFKFVYDWKSKPTKVDVVRFSEFLKNNRHRFVDEDKLKILLDMIADISKYADYDQNEKEETGLVLHKYGKSYEYLFVLEFEKNAFASLEDYLKFEFYIQYLTAKRHPFKKSGLGLGNIELLLAKDDDDSKNIDTVLSAVHSSFVQYSILFGGQDEKVFQDLLMKKRIVTELSERLFGNRKHLIPVEEELDLPTKHRRTADEDKEDNGRIDNVYVAVSDEHPRFVLMEVKYDDLVISSFDSKGKCTSIGIYSHLADLYYTITTKKEEFERRLDEVRGNITIRNTYVKEEDKIEHTVSSDKMSYLIVCGYSSTEQKQSIENKIFDKLGKAEIKKTIELLAEKEIDVKIILLAVENLLSENMALRQVDFDTYEDITAKILSENC